MTADVTPPLQRMEEDFYHQGEVEENNSVP